MAFFFIQLELAAREHCATAILEFFNEYKSVKY